MPLGFGLGAGGGGAVGRGPLPGICPLVPSGQPCADSALGGFGALGGGGPYTFVAVARAWPFSSGSPFGALAGLMGRDGV